MRKAPFSPQKTAGAQSMKYRPDRVPVSTSLLDQVGVVAGAPSTFARTGGYGISFSRKAGY
jgi:hypothetical protein